MRCLAVSAIMPKACYDHSTSMIPHRFLLILPACVLVWAIGASGKVTVHVDAASDLGTFAPVWNYFGYDEPNYTYAPNGKKLLGELSRLDGSPVYVRMHNLLTSGDGTAGLKWGSTNAYSEDASGKSIYDWTILDRIFDTLHEAHLKPLVEIGFMPQALSIRPRPYRHNWPHGELFTGWAYPPKDYHKWAELVTAWVHREVRRYGKAEVESWPWEVWNEPDIAYWKGTPQEYFELYDYSADAVKRALPTAQVGGPDSTGPGGGRAADFLRDFLDHCAQGANAATSGAGAPLDFISFHPKGSPKVVDGHVRMGMDAQVRSIDRGFQIVASFPRYHKTPIILGESDPEGCAACPATDHPENAYRNGPLYAAYTAVMLKNTLDLAALHQVNLRGICTWAFEFEGQPYFAGFRTLSTNGIDKPVLNAFRVFGRMEGRRLKVESPAAIAARQVERDGVRGADDIDALAAGRKDRISVLLWDYHDDDVPAPDQEVTLVVEQLPAAVHRVTVRQWRIDHGHSNAFEAWKQLGSPQVPTPAQYRQLERAGALQQLGRDDDREAVQGQVRLTLWLPRQGLDLVELRW